MGLCSLWWLIPWLRSRHHNWRRHVCRRGARGHGLRASWLASRLQEWQIEIAGQPVVQRSRRTCEQCAVGSGKRGPIRSEIAREPSSTDKNCKKTEQCHDGQRDKAILPIHESIGFENPWKHECQDGQNPDDGPFPTSVTPGVTWLYLSSTSS
jgi:hypothetical protein